MSSSFSELDSHLEGSSVGCLQASLSIYRMIQMYFNFIYFMF